MSALTAQEYLKTLTEATAEAIVLAKMDYGNKVCLVVEVNSVAEKMFGRPQADILNAPLAQLLAPADRDKCFDVLLANRSCESASNPQPAIKKLTGWNEQSQKAFPAVVDVGYASFDQVDYVVAKIQDDSERSALRESLMQERNQLKSERDRMALVLRVGLIGLWTWDSEKGQLLISDSWHRMTGQSVEEQGEINSMLIQLSKSGLSQRAQLKHLIAWWASFLHADDAEEAKQKMEQYLLLHLESENGYQNQYRFRRSDGSFITISAQGRASWDDEEQLASLYIAQTEITRFTESNQALERQLSELKQAQEQSAETVDDAAKLVQQLIALAKIAVPLMITAITGFSEVGQDLFQNLSRGAQNINVGLETQINERSLNAVPVLNNGRDEILKALTDYRQDADSAVFGHYSLGRDLDQNAARELSVGRIYLQVRRENIPQAPKSAWPLVGQQPYEARAQAHLQGNCYTINTPILSGISYQVSCPVYLEELEGPGFVAIEFRRSVEDPSRVETRVKQLAIAVEEAVARMETQSGAIYAGGEQNNES